MKKLLSLILTVVLTLSLSSFGFSVAYAGGYCPTWVKTSPNTPEASVQNSGDTFLASTFSIKAGIDADAVISSITVVKKGDLDSKNISQIYIADKSGKKYGTYSKALTGKVAKIKLTNLLTVKKNSTMEINVYVKTKLNLWNPTGSYGSGITIGLSDFTGSIVASDKLLASSFQNTNLYCSSYGELKDPVFGTYDSVMQFYQNAPNRY